MLDFCGGTLRYGFWCVTICCLLLRRLLAAAVPIHIQNMVYRPGLTGLTGWLKSRQLTDLYTLFCSTLAYISQRLQQ